MNQYKPKTTFIMKQFAPRKCKECGQPFYMARPLQFVCCIECANKYAAKQQAKKRAAEVKKNKRLLRKRKEALKPKSKLLQEAQAACNRYIRERDKNDPCISCGRHDYEIKEHIRGGKWDAGHYRTRGAAPELRFHPMNIHKQCKSCNGGSGRFSRKDATVSKEYRQRLIDKIGQINVEWLEGSHDIQHLTADDIREIKSYYKDQLKSLEQ